MRLHAQTATIENGFVHLPFNAHWLADYLREMTIFPAGRHDDQVDFYGPGARLGEAPARHIGDAGLLPPDGEGVGRGARPFPPLRACPAGSLPFAATARAETPDIVGVVERALAKSSRPARGRRRSARCARSASPSPAAISPSVRAGCAHPAKSRDRPRRRGNRAIEGHELGHHALEHMDRQMDRQRRAGRGEGGQCLALGHGGGAAGGAGQHHRLGDPGQGELGPAPRRRRRRPARRA